MTKQVALADDTYRRLKQNRLRGESFSKTIERLLDNQAKDPLSFGRRVGSLPMDPAAWLKRIEADRESTRTRA